MRILPPLSTFTQGKYPAVLTAFLVFAGCAGNEASMQFDNAEQIADEGQTSQGGQEYDQEIVQKLECEVAPSAGSDLKLAWEMPAEKINKNALRKELPEWKARVLADRYQELQRSKALKQLRASPGPQESRPRGSAQAAEAVAFLEGGAENGAVGSQTSRIGQPQGRMVHYDGSITQRSTRPEAVLDSAIRYVRSLGGDVEKRDNQSATLRIPVEKFRTAFDSLLKFAEVLDKSISALDITESFRDNELRIKIARATIERLKAILLKTEKDEEKIRLLNEIKRVSETLEGLERQREALRTSADFSTLRLSVVPYHPEVARYARDEITGFRWIKGLTPFKTESRNHGDYLTFGIPKGMVLVGSKNYQWGKFWRAGSADGAEYWSGRRENCPRGNTEFWFSAIKERMNYEFADVDTMTAGNYKILRFRSYGADPYVYLIGIHAHEKDLDIVEVYFPSQAQEDRYRKDIISSIAGGAQ